MPMVPDEKSRGVIMQGSGAHRFPDQQVHQFEGSAVGQVRQPPQHQSDDEDDLEAENFMQ